MFREMRRKDRQTSRVDAIELLKTCEYGVLATSDRSNMPYVIPISYVYMDESIYLHSALDGHKLDNIKSNSNISFCVVGNTKVLAEKFSTAYKSAVVFGTASIVEDNEEKNKALLGLIEKYSSKYLQAGKEYIQRAAAATCVIKIKIEHISGKQRIQ